MFTWPAKASLTIPLARTSGFSPGAGLLSSSIPAAPFDEAATPATRGRSTLPEDVGPKWTAMVVPGRTRGAGSMLSLCEPAASISDRDLRVRAPA
jgi:hypothetical protein